MSARYVRFIVQARLVATGTAGGGRLDEEERRIREQFAAMYVQLQAEEDRQVAPGPAPPSPPIDRGIDPVLPRDSRRGCELTLGEGDGAQLAELAAVRERELTMLETQEAALFAATGQVTDRL